VLARRKTSSHVARPDPTTFPPPNLRALGILPFTREDRATLSAWLAEDGWPRGHMDIETLEGYLAALLIWPVAVAPGAWLPPIWGQEGWKVPAKVASPTLYRRYVDLLVGFLQHLDSELSVFPPRFAPTLSVRAPNLRSRTPPGIPWAQGFLKALQQGSEGLRGRSNTARSAVSCIARYASSPAVPTRVTPVCAFELTAAVRRLAAERSSRGPLGALTPSDLGRLAPRTFTPTASENFPTEF
jgi:yecA family protein